MSQRSLALLLSAVVCLAISAPGADGHTAYYKLARLTADEAFMDESTDPFGITTVRMTNGRWMLVAKEDKTERIRYSCEISYSLDQVLDYAGKSTVKKVEIGALGLKEIELNCRRHHSRHLSSTV